MQHSYKDYDPKKHECRKALTVKLPYAEWIAQGSKRIEVRSKPTKYRGELIICSSAQPVIADMQAGVMLCAVQLYDVKPLEQLTPEEWELTRLPADERESYKGYAWFLRNPVRLVEYPVKGNLGIWNLVLDDLEFIPYEVHKFLIDDGKKPKPFDLKAALIGLSVILIIFVLAGLGFWGVLNAFLS